MPEVFDPRKARAAAWFRQLRDQIVAAFEGLEDTQRSGPTADMAAGRFEVNETTRADGGGGLMSVMRGGRVFEKVGVHVSTVHGTLSPDFAKTLPGAADEGAGDGPETGDDGGAEVAQGDAREQHVGNDEEEGRFGESPREGEAVRDERARAGRGGR